MARPDYDGPDRRAAIGDLPWWVRAIAIIGIPGAIAVYLVYVGATEIPKIKAEMLATRAEVIENQRIITRLTTQSSSTFRMLQRVCSNTATTEEKRQRCFDEQ